MHFPSPETPPRRETATLRFALALGGGLLLLVPAPAVNGAGKDRDWHGEGAFRWAELEVTSPGKVGFTRVPSSVTGLEFTNTLDDWSGAANRVLYNGAGVAAGDYDADGRPDLFYCNLNGTNALFRNLGNWRFTNVTAEAGLAVPCLHSRGAVFADVNGDRCLDLLVSATGQGVRTFLNDGHGKFVDATQSAGTGSTMGSQTLALADVDGNGTLDLYVANNRPDDIRDRGQAKVTVVNGRPTIAGTDTNRFVFLNNRLEERGQADQLFLNDGHGHFQLVSWTGGAFLDELGRPLAEPPLDWGLTATFRDVNGDLAPDLYVCNDYWTPDHLWINDGHGRFRAVEPFALRKITASSMSIDLADIDRDGDLDILVVDMLSRYPHLRKRQLYAQMPRATPVGLGEDRPQVMRNTLFLNRGDGTFAEIAYYANVPASDWSWAPLFLDVDLDGYEDLLIGAGYFRDVQDYDAEALIRSRQHSWAGFSSEAARQKAFTQELMEHYRLYPTLFMPIGTWRNLGNCTFQETTDAWGLTDPGVHQGLALADFDGDGDLDLAVNNLNGAATLYRNDATAPRVAVRLQGRSPNPQGIGARIALIGGALPTQTTELTCGGHYQSGCDPQAVFAAGAAAGGMTLEVRWRSGARTVVEGVKPNRIYEVTESDAKPTDTPAASRPEPPPLFEDATKAIAHQHHEIEFDDYERQPLLPFKLSQAGPGVAWFDLDGDGHDDLVVGAGRGGRLALLRGDGQGRFRPEPLGDGLADDATGLVGWVGADNRRTFCAGLSGYESSGVAGAPVLAWSGPTLSVGPPLPQGGNTSSALAAADLDGNGQWVLLVGGGVVPGQYPLGAPSRLYRWNGQQWALDGRNNVLLENLGIVNGAVWTDLDGDGFPELVLACEWGPIRAFRTRGGAFSELTQSLGLSAHTGWWRGVTAGDVNGDGRMDLIASNWGLNSPYRASPNQPLVLVYGQLTQPGVMDLIETEYAGNTLVPSRQFQAMAQAMPFLMEQFTSHKAYSEASLAEVLGERAPLSRRVAVTTLASTVFLNTDRGFQATALPQEAQFAPAFAVSVADLDGDGHEDVFLSQNFFALQPENNRVDAGLGVWLRGDGAGNLHAVSSLRSGLRIYGQQRGAALGDFDEDGRVDLAVSQNGAATRLYHNRGATPGLRVRLQGAPFNPGGVGAVVRLQFKDRLGPARELHAGSGYWSQDSLIPVMATPEPPQAIWIRWPGGRVTTTPLGSGLREVTVNLEGRLVATR